MLIDKNELQEQLLTNADEEQSTQITNALSDRYEFWQRCASASDFLLRLWRQKPDFFLKLAKDRAITQDLNLEDFQEELASLLGSEDLTVFDAGIRQMRQYQMSRFIVRDIHNLCSTAQLMRELSFFADAAITVTHDFHYELLAARFGQPVGAQSNMPQQMLVIAMGKLGACELNLSSDIDLIFSYPESGETDGKKCISNQQFFLKLGQAMIKSLDAVTADGFVFRVDMRLRPYGQSGALASSFDALELYYEQQGREWERYAMVKARIINGPQEAIDDLTARLKPFVFRKYTDFSAIASLREMKRMIAREVQRKGKQMDVKLGSGGIREIEFIAQAFQLIHGGRDEPLQNRSVIKVLKALAEREILNAQDVEHLIEAYFFLRDVEHAIQGINDEHSQQLPDDERKQQQILTYLSIDHWQDLLNQLDEHRSHVSQVFQQIIVDPNETEQEASDTSQSLWFDRHSDDFLQQLMEAGFSETEATLLVQFCQDDKVNRLGKIAAERLDIFMPQLFALLLDDDGDKRTVVLKDFVELLYAILRRTSYLVLFNENPLALSRLYNLATSSSWVMSQMTKHPVLIDELISPNGLGVVPEKRELASNLQQQGLRIAIDDIEAQMQMLRYFKLAHHMHIVAAEITGKLPLMRVSDYLSFLAESILEYVLQLSFSQLVEKHGYPQKNGESVTTAEFAIIAYGKLGGLELGHNSDLDLVFLYDANDQEETDGAKPLNNRTFFSRMGQKIIHILNTQMMLGQIYEIDMRLRPSGAKGLLASSTRAFEKYQQESAWTWEKQALVRGRAVAGSQKVIDVFNRVRQEQLCAKRDMAILKDEVQQMRQKMHDHLLPKDCKAPDSKLFHLKHSRGGVVDIEFMVQYLVLAHSNEHPALTKYTDNIRILEVLAKEGLLSEKDAQAMIEAYRTYRTLGHRLALQLEQGVVEQQQVVAEKTAMSEYWQQIFN